MLLFAGAFRRNAVWTHRLLACLAAPPIIVLCPDLGMVKPADPVSLGRTGLPDAVPAAWRGDRPASGRRWVRRLIVCTAVLELAVVTTIALQIQFDWLGNGLAAVMRRDPTDEGLDWRSVRTDLDARGLLPPGGVAAA